MNVVDSSGWLEYFSDGPNASHFQMPLSDLPQLIVPTITIYEVFKVLLREKDEVAALQGVAAMQSATVVDLTSSISLSAAAISLKHSLPMADSIIMATAKSHKAILWTQDADFEGMVGVKYFAKT
ncbi:MAG: type II toxin-antitoxin system VapC family toxin [Magnetococcales bacterium]|nr:type II toxin-antitoxin system VapC family toxin [Magnetococcales bacterium]